MNEKIKKKTMAFIKKTPGISELIAILSRPRVVSWMLILAFLAIVMASLFVSPRIFEAQIHEGDVALGDIYAPYDFTYKWGVDEERTQLVRAEAREAVPHFLEREEKALEKARERIENFFEDVAAAREVDEASRYEYLQKLYPDVLTSPALVRAVMDYPEPAKLREDMLKLSDEIYDEEIVSEQTMRDLDEAKAQTLSLKSSPKQIIEKDELMTIADAEKQSVRFLKESFPGRFDLHKALLALLERSSDPELSYDAEYTRQMKKDAVEETEPVLETWTIKKNEIIISKGKRVNARDIARLSAMRRVFRPGITPVFFLGVLLMFGLLGLAWWVYNHLFGNRSFTEDSKELTIVLLNMLVMILIAHWIVRLPHPSYFIPLAGMAILISLLAGFAQAIIALSLVGIVIALLFAAGIETFFVLMIAGFVGIYAARDARRRAQIIWAGLAAGAAKFLAVGSIGLINKMPVSFFLNDGLWSFASGIFSAFLVLALLPVFEQIFKVPTNITMVELSDLNHPLLKKLATQAPGTYHHSILVGNLAEAACEAVGANSLRARVGAYYHDIGKIDKAEYFNENESIAGPKHSNLAPTMSALIISQHVKKGLELAKKYKLNSVIRDFIGQHHGESLISFFYQKAVKDAGENGKTLKEQDFRYPGPRPQTKEAAIVLLADSVEAATRSLSQATRSNIRNRVSKIINEKFIDGQLDECELTLRDIHEISDSFVKVLTSIYHKRMQYPDENKDKPGNGASDVQDKHKKFGSESKP